MRYVLGIDQGSSKTVAILSDENGNILGAGYADGATHVSQGMDYSMQAVRNACEQAIQHVGGISMSDIALIVAGMSGADWPYEYDLLRSALRQTTSINNIEVFNDCIIAFRAGTDKPYGAVLCAGSGLNSAIISPDGREQIYGYYIDNEVQGGFALGSKAVRAVIASAIGVIQPTALTNAALKYFNVSNADELLYRLQQKRISSSEIKDFAPSLFATADKGDTVAAEIIAHFGLYSAKYVVAGLNKFDMLDMDVDVVLSGSIFKTTNPVLYEAVSLEIHKAAPKAHIVNSVYEPVVGAAMFALDKIHDGEINSQIKMNIFNSSRELGLIRVK